MKIFPTMNKNIKGKTQEKKKKYNKRNKGRNHIKDIQVCFQMDTRQYRTSVTGGK